MRAKYERRDKVRVQRKAEGAGASRVEELRDLFAAGRLDLDRGVGWIARTLGGARDKL